MSKKSKTKTRTERWMKRKRDGRSYRFKTGVQLVCAFNDYCKWNKKNPLQEEKVFFSSSTGEITRTCVAKKRAMTIAGFCLHLGANRKSWYDWEKTPHLKNAVAVIKDAIVTQKFEGAAAGFFKESLIARDLGLVDKKEHSGGFTVVLGAGDEDL